MSTDTIDRVSSGGDDDVEARDVRDDHRRPTWTQRTSVRVFTATSLATLVLLCIRNRYVFSQPIHEDGDAAANSILIQKAIHFHLLVGQYSRVGFNHPGPAFLYIEAAGQVLFYRLTHLVPSPYDGQLLAVFALNAVLIGLVASIFYRHTRSALIVGVVDGVILVYASRHLNLSSSWMPHMFFAPFLLITVAGASIAANGNLDDLPAFVLAGGLLVHGHVSFIEFVGASTAVVAVAWWFRCRRDWRARLTEYRRHVVLAGGLLAVFLLPMVLNVILHYPGEWGKYWAYVRQSRSRMHPLGSAVRYLMSFWAALPRSGVLLAGLGLAGGALTVLERDPARRRFFACVLAGVAIMSVLFLGYAVRGVDDLSQSYLGIFYMAMPLLVIAIAAATVASAVLGHGHGRLHSVRTFGVAGLAVVLLAVGTVGPWLTNRYRGESEFPGAVSAVKANSQRAGRPVAIDFATNEWPQVIGFVVEASRSGLRSCVASSYWTFMFTSQYVCSPAVTDSAWRIRIDQPTGASSPAPGLVWSDSQMVVTAPNS